MILGHGNIRCISDTDLVNIVGGGTHPIAPKPESKESRNLMGAAAAGALAGLVQGAPGGPGGMVVGALEGTAIGVSAYMANSYITGGDKSKIPSRRDNASRPSWADFRRMDNAKK